MDDTSQQTQDTSVAQDTAVAQDSAPLMPDPIADGSLGNSANTPFTDDATQTTAFTDQPADSVPQTPFEDVGASSATSDDTSQDSTASDDIGAVYAEQSGVASPEPVTEDAAPSDDETNQAASYEVSGDLLAIKQQALEELSPLVSQLDQTPEEKFRTIMMLIQASDNQKLVPDAYDAAKAISDEKARAQALLDVVNEINYFSHNKK